MIYKNKIPQAIDNSDYQNEKYEILENELMECLSILGLLIFFYYFLKRFIKRKSKV